METKAAALFTGRVKAPLQASGLIDGSRQRSGQIAFISN